MAHRGPRVGVGGGFLDIPQRNTCVQRGVFGGSVRVSPGLILLKAAG